MFQTADTIFGKEVVVPAGLNARCVNCEDTFTTDGSERAVARKHLYENGESSWEEDLVSFFFRCPGCATTTLQFKTFIRVDQWYDMYPGGRVV